MILKIQIQRRDLTNEKFDKYNFNRNRFKTVNGIYINTSNPEEKIKTESQFCGYIYNMFGEGRYKCQMWRKKQKGWIIFWIGNIYENGFIRDLNKNKELMASKATLERANRQRISYEEREILQEDIDLEKEINSELGKKRRGPIGILKMRAGIMHAYEEY